MKDRRVKQLFEQDTSLEGVSQAGKQRMFCFLEKEIQNKKMVPQLSKWELVRSQIKFMDKKIMGLEMVCFAVFMIFYIVYGNRFQGVEQYMYGTMVSVIFSTLMAVSWNREERQGIGELVGSCYFNNRQLCALRLTVYGVWNVIFLTFILLCIHGNVGKSLIEIGIYLLVPYLSTGCIHFFILFTKWGRESHYAVLAGAGVMILIWGYFSNMPEIYEKTAIAVWAAALVISIGLYGAELVWMLHQMERGERLCMN